MKTMKIIFLSLLISFVYCPFSQAEVNDSKLLEDSINDMYVVASSGLGGAIIGLSTLSFVSEPGDHLKTFLSVQLLVLLVVLHLLAIAQRIRARYVL